MRTLKRKLLEIIQWVGSVLVQKSEERLHTMDVEEYPSIFTEKELEDEINKTSKEIEAELVNTLCRFNDCGICDTCVPENRAFN